MSWFHPTMHEEFMRIDHATRELRNLIIQYQQQGPVREHISDQQFNEYILQFCQTIITHMKQSEAMTGKAVLDLRHVRQLTLEQVRAEANTIQKLLSTTLEPDIRLLLANLQALQRHLEAWERQFLAVIDEAKQSRCRITDPAMTRLFSEEGSPAVIASLLRNVQVQTKKLGVDLAKVLDQYPEYYFRTKVDHYVRRLAATYTLAA